MLLVAEEDSGDPFALVLGTEVKDDESGATVQINAFYLLDRQGQGIGRWLLQAAVRELASMGFSRPHIGDCSEQA